MLDLFLLLVLFQLKHFLADFPLQGRYMLGKFSRDRAVWIPALLAHCAVHALLTLLICGWWGWSTVATGVVILLAALDFAVHFVVDRVKASPDLLGRWKPDSRYFWWALGADQAAHHLTHYVIIYWLLSGHT